MMKTNAPRMVTVLFAVGLTFAGLSLAVFEIAAVDTALMDVVTAAGVDLTKEQVGWLALLLSPLALTAGSLLKDV